MTSHPAGRTRGGRGMPRAAVFCMAASAFLAASTFPATAAQAASSSASSSFDRVFAAQGEPASTHFAAEYRTGGVAHRVEVWRDGERRIRRRTDDAAESIALRKPDSPEFKLSVFDLKRHIVTDIDRSNLYRIGNFTDWYDLGHGLRHPKGAYTLRAAAAPGGAPDAVATCAWYDLTQAGRTTHVCWSARDRLPLLMLDAAGHVAWRVTQVDHRPIAAAAFAVDGRGYVRNDANADIERD